MSLRNPCQSRKLNKAGSVPLYSPVSAFTSFNQRIKFLVDIVKATIADFVSIKSPSLDLSFVKCERNNERIKNYVSF